MISTKHWKSYYQDNLVLRVETKDGRMFSQGKRLPNNASALLRKLQRAYVEKGAVSATKLIREEEFLSLKDSLKVFNILRGKELFSWTHKQSKEKETPCSNEQR